MLGLLWCIKYIFFNKGFWVCSKRLISTDFSFVTNVNRLVTFVITSYDVIHSWSIPSAGIKVDASPGRMTTVKSRFLVKGYYYGQCSELCGYLHGFMPISLLCI